MNFGGPRAIAVERSGAYVRRRGGAFPQIVSADFFPSTPEVEIEAGCGLHQLGQFHQLKLQGTSRYLARLALQLNWKTASNTAGRERYFDDGWYASAGYFTRRTTPITCSHGVRTRNCMWAAWVLAAIFPVQLQRQVAAKIADVPCSFSWLKLSN